MNFKNRFEIIVFLLITFGHEIKTVTAPKTSQKNKDSFLSTTTIISKYGYPAETHKVTTEDAYILSLHRIPHGKHLKKSDKKFPVFFQHGFQGTSAGYVVLGPDNSLGKFRQFDYKKNNGFHYEKREFPEYNISNICTSLNIVEGLNDKVSVPKDVATNLLKLKSIKRIEYVNYTHFNHVDFLYSKFAKTTLYHRIFKIIDEIENETRQLINCSKN